MERCITFFTVVQFVLFGRDIIKKQEAGFSSLVECWWNECGCHVVVWLEMNQIVWVDDELEMLEESRYTWYTSYWFCGHDIEHVYELQPRGKEKKYIAFHAYSCSALYCAIFKISLRNNYFLTENKYYCINSFLLLLLLYIYVCCTIFILFHDH